jgi:DNA mismatch repair protein MutH
MDLKDELFHEGQRLAAKIKLAEAQLTKDWDELNDHARIAAQDAIAELEDQLVKIRNRYDDLKEDSKDLYDAGEAFTARVKSFAREHKLELFIIASLVVLGLVLIIL